MAADGQLPNLPMSIRRNHVKKSLFALAIALAFGTVASVQAQPAPAAASAPATINDAQIAHIAYTAGQIDVTAAKQALKKSHNKAVIAFAEEMARDHAAVNEQALALCKKLGVTPADNPTSQALAKAAAAEQVKLAALSGDAYDKAYAANEVAFHQTVNKALSGTLIPSARNEELKSLLETGLKLFESHQMHAEHLAQSLK
jgi:putative membrane protein